MERVQRGNPYTKRKFSAPDFESSLVIIVRSPQNSGFVATPSSFPSTDQRGISSFAPRGQWRDKWHNPPVCVVRLAPIPCCSSTVSPQGSGCRSSFARRCWAGVRGLTMPVCGAWWQMEAVRNRGTLMFRLYRGGLSILKYLRFIRDLQRDAGHPIVLIVDNLRIHHARIVKAWLRKRRHLIRVFYLPAYSPELNPDELVNSDLKIAIGQREPAQDRDELQAQMQEHMVANQRNPEKMQRLFHKESVKYASHMEN